MRQLMTAAVTTFLVAASATAQTEDTSQPQPPDPRRETAMQTESRVLNLMRLSNQAEIRAAEVVLERTGSDTVRRFADRLLRDHRLSDEMLGSLAESKGIALISSPFDGDSSAPVELSAAPPPDDDTFRSLEGDDLYRQPLGQSPSLAPRAEDRRAPGRLSANPLQHGQEQAQAPEGWDLPQINEPPSAAQVNWQEPVRPSGQEGEADQPRDAASETPGQSAAAALRQDPPPPAAGEAAERPLDLEIARLKAERMLRELESADDTSIDGVYAAAMIQSHDETVQNLRTGLQSVADADVADLLETFIPILEQHGRLARHVQRELGGPPAGEADPAAEGEAEALDPEMDDERG